MGRRRRRVGVTKTESPNTSSEDEVNVKDHDEEGEAVVGSLGTDGGEGDVVDAENTEKVEALIQEYRAQTTGTTEVALTFLCDEIHHPVISYFRELTGPDVNWIINNMNKFKKRMGTLEQGVLFVGLIDFLAIADNALYADPEKKWTQRVPIKVQKLMMEFKNIIGGWGLSSNGNEAIRERYPIVMKHLRQLIPLFERIGFGNGFSSILDSLDREIKRNLQNSEKIKALSTIHVSSTSVTTDVMALEDSETPKINLDISMDIDDCDDEEEDENNSVKTSESKIDSPERSDLRRSRPVKIVKKKAVNAMSPITRLKEEERIVPTIPKGNERVTLSQGKALRETYSPEPSKLTTVNNSIVPVTEISMSSRLEEPDENVSSPRKKPRVVFENISNDVSSPLLPALHSPTPTPKIETIPNPVTPVKPKVNAFTLLMKRSKEISMESKNKLKKK